MHIDLPPSATSRHHYDKVLGQDDKIIDPAHYAGYAINERARLSLGSAASWVHAIN